MQRHESSFMLDSTQERDEAFDCDFFKPDVCNPAIAPCSQVENCENTYGKNPPGLRHACYVAWTNDTVNGVKVKLKGCWLAQDIEPFDCGSDECVSDSPGSTMFKNDNGGPVAYFCCCNKARCNERFDFRPATSTVRPKLIDTSQPASNSTDATATLVYAFAPICLLALLTVICYWIYRRYKIRKAVKRIARGENAGGLTFPLKIPPSPTDASKTIELIEIVSRGRYGSVWKAKMGDQLVAVKVFPPQDVDSWVQEQEIYATSGLKNHGNILRYLGAECRGNGGIQTEYWLITTFHELGSLHDFLKTNSITVPEMLTIATSMLRGLAYLHEETSGMNDQQAFKPTIVHRDFKSKNVLLKNGLIACIADYGLALKCTQGRIPNDVHAQVGTRRYMAPEVLEGATEFNAFAFRQIDVYAAALVVWEVISRCSFAGEKADVYRLPYEEIGTKPTLEELQEHVVVKKLRPVFKPSWRQHAQAAVICSTIEEMWDPEPEARVTAGCALERFSALHLSLESTPPVITPNHRVNEPQVVPQAGTLIEKLETTPLIVSDIPVLLDQKAV